MKIVISALPVALLVAYSQLVIKWRGIQLLSVSDGRENQLFTKLMLYLFDPYILSGYVAALMGSFIWLGLVAKLPLAMAFPIYIGLTFLLIILGSAIWLGEPINSQKFFAIILILTGVIVGSRV